MFGWSSCGIYVLSGRSFDQFSNVISNISNSMKTDDEEDKKYYIENVKNILKNTNRNNLEFNEMVNTKIREAYKNLQDNNRKEYIPILDKYFEFNKAIMDKFFRDTNVDCIEDLDIFFEKLSSIRRLINNSDRYYRLKEAKYYFDNINHSDSWTILHRYIETYNIPLIITEFDSIIKVIQRM
jgi:DNA replicative helicase MCM subunit Mcm2 (Cdc46/Mcm family)